MVWFTFTFLLGIPNETEKEKEKEEEEEETEGKEEEKKEKSQVDSDYVEIEITKPNFSYHIEYVLTPWETAKFIDVVCWNGVAKIYFENSTSAIVPLKAEKLQWIHFRVNHEVMIKMENVSEFRLHNVRFSVTVGNKNLKEPAKSDKPNKFYGPNFAKDGVEDKFRKQLFQPLSENLDDLQAISVFKEYLTSEQQFYIALDTTLETNPNYKKLFKVISDLSNEYHDDNFERKPSPSFEEIPPLVDITQPPSITQHQPSTEQAAGKKGKEIKQDKKNSATDEQIRKRGKSEKKSLEKVKEPEMGFAITGEQFLSGRKTFQNYLKYNSDELPFLYCLGAVKNILTSSQTKIYNPLSIVISSLNYLPVDELQNVGVTKIKFKFLICDQFLSESNLIPIEWKMKIDFARTIFTDMLNHQKLIYYIQTGGLTIEVLGCKEKVNAVQECVLLGKVWADISPILLRPHRILLKCNFQMSLLSPGKENSVFTSINEFNECRKRGKEENVNLLRNYSKASIVLTLRVGLGEALTSTWQKVISNPDLYNRLFVIFYKPDLAIPIIQMIQSEVDDTLGLMDYTKNGINLKRPLSMYNKEGKGKIEYPKTKMTGFIIDCIDKILIYVESSVFGEVQKVWATTSFMSTQQGRVLFDSSLIFLDRLYENLFRFGGFIGISLKESPNEILSKPLSWGRNSIPRPAMKALRSLTLLADCRSIKVAVQGNLFPDFESLASLAIEFGRPIKISVKR